MHVIVHLKNGKVTVRVSIPRLAVPRQTLLAWRQFRPPECSCKNAPQFVLQNCLWPHLTSRHHRGAGENSSIGVDRMYAPSWPAKNRHKLAQSAAPEGR